MLAGAITGGMSLLGGIIGSGDQNAASAASIAQQEKFQKDMSSTVWERGVDDMQKAGLNPYLAYSQGPASAPGGGSYTPQNTLDVGMRAGEQGAASAAGLIQAAQDINLKGSQIANVDADTIRKAADTKNILQSTSASKTNQLTNTPESMEMGAIKQLYEQHPTLLKAKAIWDAVTGTVSNTASTAQKVGDAYYGATEAPIIAP